MTFKKFISEEYLTSIKSRYGTTCEIWKNPKPDELQEIMKAADIDKEIRGWLDPATQNVYMWASNTGEHMEVAKHNKFPETYIPFYVLYGRYEGGQPQVSVSMNALDDTYNIYDRKTATYINRSLGSNKYLHSILGSFHHRTL